MSTDGRENTTFEAKKCKPKLKGRTLLMGLLLLFHSNNPMSSADFYYCYILVDGVTQCCCWFYCTNHNTESHQLLYKSDKNLHVPWGPLCYRVCMVLNPPLGKSGSPLLLPPLPRDPHCANPGVFDTAIYQHFLSGIQHLFPLFFLFPPSVRANCTVRATKAN